MNAAAAKTAPKPKPPKLDWRHLLIAIAGAAAAAAANIGVNWLNNKLPMFPGH